MNEDPRRAHQRVKDDKRVCRARLDEASGGSIELSVIDMSAGGAALCGAKDTSHVPSTSAGRLSRGFISFKIPSTAKGKASRTVDIGPYEVVRDWGRGPGEDAGIAVRFTTPSKDWLKLMDGKQFQARL
jgi:hypothetical protein